MRKYMAVTLMLCAAMLLVTIACAANLAIYTGKATSNQLGSWGNGKVAVSTEVKKGTTSALEINTRGYSEGGYFMLSAAADLSEYFTMPTKSFLNLQVKIPAQAAPGGGGGGRRRGATPAANDWQSNYAQMQMPGMQPGGMQPGGMMMPGMQPGGMQPGGMMMPGMQPGGMQPGGMMMPGMQPGGMQPGGMMGGPGGSGTRGSRTPTIVRVLDAVRVLLITDKGQLDAGSFKMEDLKKTDDWAEISIPFSALKGKGGGSGAKLEAVVLTGNAEGKFYVAKIELVK